MPLWTMTQSCNYYVAGGGREWGEGRVQKEASKLKLLYIVGKMYLQC